MVTEPVETPVTTPDDAPTVARALLGVHVPPAVPEEVSVIGAPEMDTDDGPDSTPAFGSALTVTFDTILHPVLFKVKVIFGTPAPTPVTSPLDEPTVASEGNWLTHVPAPDASDNVVVPPLAHNVLVPLIAAGAGLMVTTVEVRQPVLSV